MPFGKLTSSLLGPFIFRWNKDLPENDVTNPAYLEIHTQPRNRAMWTDLHEAPVREHLTPTREILEHTNPTEIDTVFHRMEMDGVANICFRAPRKGGGHANHNARDHHDSNGADADAGTMAIYRFSARVEQSEERRPPVITDGRVINDYLTFMEQEMDRIEVSLANVIREADFAQRKDSDMHKQFEEMYATTFYWPLLHVIILLLTGYTQASHIVHFFRTRRII